MAPPVVILFTLGDIGNACDDRAARLLKEKFVRFIKDVCDERKEKGASIISITDMVTGAILESCGWNVLDEAEIAKLAREFVSHPRIKLYPFRPFTPTIHSFYRP